MPSNSLFGAVGRSLVRVAPAGVRRWAWDRVWWRPFAYTARTSDGVRMRGTTADLIQRFVYYFGQWEPAISDWLRANVKTGDTVIDVGANVGWYSLLAAKLVGPAGRVIAVEASPTIATKLAANIALNPNLAPRITVHQCAAGDRAGVIPLYAGAADNSGQTTTVGGTTVEATVPLQPLSALLAGVDLRKVRVVKIDVEGAEEAVVAGLVPVAGELPTGAAVIVETAEHTRAGVLAALAAAGFGVAGVFPNVYQPEPYLAKRYEPFTPTATPPADGQWDVLLVKG